MTINNLSAILISGTCLLVSRSAIQFFLCVVISAAPASVLADLSVGKIYPIEFTDLNGNTLSTGDGHITIIVVVTRANWTNAQAVGDRVPDIYLGDSTHRLITIVKFGKHTAPVRAVLAAGARRHLYAEARRVQPRYIARKINRDPRQDIFAVADFEGTIAAKLGVHDEAFRIFVFDRKGALLAQWNQVPAAEELALVLK